MVGLILHWARVGICEIRDSVWSMISTVGISVWRGGMIEDTVAYRSTGV